MKKIIALSVLLTALACKTGESGAPIEDMARANVGQTDSVWVCQSPSAKKYHYSRECEGLGRCKHYVAMELRNDAEAVGLTACSYLECAR